MGILLRQPLSAPTTADQIHTLSIIITSVSILSLVGAGWIILSFVLLKPLRTFRHQLILGLALSDFLTAVNFLSSATMNLSDHNIGKPAEKDFCTFNGFMIELFVVQNYWILIIAICTYLKLADHSKHSIWLEQHKLLLWLGPWLISITMASIGLGVWNFGDIGAWCWFTNDRVRLLVNFVPRWTIIITILSLYLRLYILIHKLHREHHRNDSNAPQTFNSLERNRDNNNKKKKKKKNDDDGAGAGAGAGSQVGSRGGSQVGSPPPTSTSKGTQSSKHTSGGESWMDQGRLLSHGTANVPVPAVRASAPALNRVSYRMMTYPLFYMLIWAIPTSIRIYQAVTNKKAPFGIGTVDKACIVIQGFVDAVVYGVNEKTWDLWRVLLKKIGLRV